MDKNKLILCKEQIILIKYFKSEHWGLQRTVKVIQLQDMTIIKTIGMKLKRMSDSLTVSEKNHIFNYLIICMVERRVLCFENIQKGMSREIIYLIRGNETLWNLSL